MEASLLEVDGFRWRGKLQVEIKVTSPSLQLALEHQRTTLTTKKCGKFLLWPSIEEYKSFCGFKNALLAVNQLKWTSLSFAGACR